MGRIAEVVSFAQRTIRGISVGIVRFATGSDDDGTADYYGPSGEDSPPLAGDFCRTVDNVDGGEQAIGFHDVKNAGKALPGEKRIYARDEDGTLVGEFWIKRDGTIRIQGNARIQIDAPEITLGDGSAPVSTAGDIVTVVVPPLVAGPFPVLPVVPTLVASTGGYIASGRILRRQSKVKA